MKSILVAIVRALAAMPRIVAERVLISGQWIWSLVQKPAPAMPDAGLPEVDHAAQADVAQAAMAAAEYDMEMSAIRTVAAHMRSGYAPPAALVEEIDERTMNWLCALNPEMLAAVVKSSPQELRAHVMGRRSLKGVLINDDETIRLFTRPKNESIETPDWMSMPTPARYT